MKILYLTFLILVVGACGVIKYSVNGIKPYYFYVGDWNNKRVLVWKAVPQTLNQPPDFVLGQTDFTSQSTAVNSASIGRPDMMTTNGEKLIVVDEGSHRILIWNRLPTSSNQPADVEIGQPDFSSNGTNGSGALAANCGRGFQTPLGIALVGRKLVMADDGNDRVLVWNDIPTTNFQSADVVIGQSNFCVNGADSGGRIVGLHSPTLIGTDGEHLCVSDTRNHRVLVYNHVPTANWQSADLVLGQPDMTTGTINNTPGAVGTPSAQSLNFPSGCFFVGGKFYVSDGSNHRVLGWNSIPTSNQQPADFVLGQTSFSGGSANAGLATPTAATLSSPQQMTSDGIRFYVSDFGNSRVLMYNNAPITTNQSADMVVGQTSFSGASANAGLGSVHALGINTTVSVLTNGMFQGVTRPEGY